MSSDDKEKNLNLVKLRMLYYSCFTLLVPLTSPPPSPLLIRMLPNNIYRIYSSQRPASLNICSSLSDPFLANVNVAFL